MMNGEICDNCGNKISTIGDEFVRIQTVKNTQSQGLPDQFVKNTEEYCKECMVNINWPV